MARLNRVAGTNGDDILDGDDLAQFLLGDRLQGRGGNDTLFGGAGEDVYQAGTGDDTLIASLGSDDMSGGSGFDVVQYRANVNNPTVDDYFSVLGYDVNLGRTGRATIVDIDGGLDGNTGTDSLSGVEKVIFSDGDAGGLGTENFLEIFLDGTNNDALAVKDSIKVEADGTIVSGPASLLDNDLEFDGDAIMVTAVEGGAGNVGVQFALASGALLTVNADGTYFYDPNGTVLDTDSFEYTISDGIGAETTAKVSVVIQNLIDLTALTTAEGFIIQGDMVGDSAGYSVSAAGDVNGDGFDDLIVGAYAGDDGGFHAGEAYVIFGTASGFGSTDGAGRQVIDLASLDGTEGFIIQGDAADDFAGFSVSAAGDVNGDGFDDLIVGAPGGNDGGDAAGEAYVIFGTASGFGTLVGGRKVLDLTSLSADEGFVIQGDEGGDLAGYSVSAAGDVNGDGFDDLIVGASRGDDGGSYAGEAYVIFGTASGFGSAVTVGSFTRKVLDLTSLSADDGFVIQGDESGDFAGRSVSSAGDVNGDGFDDLIVGAPYGDDGGANVGEAYVIFGTASGFGTLVDDRRVLDLTSLDSTEGFVIQGDAGGGSTGRSVSAAGDVNGDGFDDLIVGAPYGGYAGSEPGEAYVIFGTASGFGTAVGGRQVIDLASLDGTEGFVIQGDAAYDGAGFSVASAGDVNGDGFDDLIVGAPFGADGGALAGQAYVIFGTDAGFGIATGGRQVLDLTSLDSTEGFVIQGDMAGDEAGFSVSAAGDVNGDGFDDLIVGAPEGDDGGNGAGEGYVIFGGDFLGDLIFVDQDFFIGTDGADTLTGDGGSDVFRAGAGDDTITPGDADFFRIDGGGGQDTLIIDFDLNLTTLANDGSNVIIQSIEVIDMSGGSGRTLTLNIDDLLDISETPNLDLDPATYSQNSLAVIGDGDDTVTLAASAAGEVGDGGGWVDTTTTVSIGGDDFAVYNYTTDGTLGGDVLGSIAIDPDIAVIV